MPTVKTILWKKPIPSGEVPVDNFQVVDVEKDLTLQEGDVLVELVFLSVDPYMRGRMSGSKGYFVGPFEANKPLDSAAVGKVIESKNKVLSVGDFVVGSLPWEMKTVVKGGNGLVKIHNDNKFPLSYFISMLGMTGFTAYSSLEQIAQPKQGETIFVSGAAGAVGQAVGQICKLKGLRVIGSAGSDSKVDFLTRELGFDAAFNYKTTNLEEELKKHAPNGIDIYYDNVGGSTLETAINHCNLHARIVACGAISDYNKPAHERYGVKNLFNIVTKRIRMEGFIVMDYYSNAELLTRFNKDMSLWIQQGKVKVFEDVVDGLENAGSAFVGLMKGDNVGKRVVKCGQH